MSTIKEQVLRTYGDHGADTLERYFAQIYYTVYWCIRMLRSREGILAVIPEAIEDVVIVRQDTYELHQVKTRDESQGPWTTALISEILCHQYHRRHAFKGACNFHFVSDQGADTNVRWRKNSFGPLYRLKVLLEIKHNKQDYTNGELEDLERFENALVPRIQQVLQEQFGETVDETTALALLHSTHIDTGSHLVREPNNVLELGDALHEMVPGGATYSTSQLRNMHDCLVLLVIGKILRGNSLAARQICTEDVLACRSNTYAPEDQIPDLTHVPGRTLLDKKARLGGFDPTELPTFHKQKALAVWKQRTLEVVDSTAALQQLTAAVLDLHAACRHEICREERIMEKPGPRILTKLRASVGSLAEKYFPDLHEIDEQFCLGLLWQQTDACSAWWHSLDRMWQENEP